MISVVVPLFQSQDTIEDLTSYLRSVFDKNGFDYEIIFVNDASPDRSASIVGALQKANHKIRLFSFPKNVGQHRAVLKGMQLSKGSIVVIMDADLQDSPNDIFLLVERLNCGFDAVFAGRSGKYQSSSRMLTSKVFKFLLHKICSVPKDAGLFVAMSRKMVDAVLASAMDPPFVIAMIGFTGLSTTSIPIQREERKIGKSAYTSFNRLKIGIQAMIHVFKWKRKSPEYSQYQKKYYEKTDHANLYPENYPKHIKRCIQHVFKRLPNAKDSRILDLGCGMGRFTIPMAKENIQIEGLDLSRELLQSCKEKAPEIPLHCSDLYNLPVELQGKYDVVIGFFVLHHLPDLDQAFQSIATLLKPGGVAVFVEPNPYNVLYYLQILFTPKMRWKAEKHMLYMRRKKIVQAMGKAKMGMFSMDRFGFFPPFLYERWEKVEKILERIFAFSPALPYQLFYGEK